MYYLVKKIQSHHVMGYPCSIIHNDFVTDLGMNHEFPFCLSKDVSVNQKKNKNKKLVIL